MPASLTDDRATVFASIRKALDTGAGKAKAALPEWKPAQIVCRQPQDFPTLVDYFRFRFEATAGVVVDGWAALNAFLQTNNVQRGYADPAFAEAVKDFPFTIDHHFDRALVEEYQFGITRATAAIAETGSLILTESGSSSRLGALSPWLHVAVLEKASILPDMPAAIASFGSERSTLFVTGPSKTADVEGILIQGVHGPGIQVCCLV
ncbi:MAG: hypothetical protein JWO94_762 [Verrucomicrobiaceae bacterium]|nr:hypothetical protein [Verrucomicrobiaceae bacterium]